MRNFEYFYIIFLNFSIIILITNKNMNNIIKTDSIDNINTELKLHILELNIAFAKRTASYPKYPGISMKSSRHDHVIFIAELVQHFQKCYNKNTSIMI